MSVQIAGKISRGDADVKPCQDWVWNRNSRKSGDGLASGFRVGAGGADGGAEALGVIIVARVGEIYSPGSVVVIAIE